LREGGGTGLGWGNLPTIALAVALAFADALTLLPLLRAGRGLRAALSLALAADADAPPVQRMPLDVDPEGLFNSRNPETMVPVVVVAGHAMRYSGTYLLRRENRERLRDMAVREVVRLLKEWHAAREGGG
jgi:hypothetical protein